MEPFSFFHQHLKDVPHKILLSILLLVIGLLGTFIILEDSEETLSKLRHLHTHQLKKVQVWKIYEQALRESSTPGASAPLSPIVLFNHYRHIPHWSRAKIKNAIESLVIHYDLRLRSLTIQEQGSSPSQDQDIPFYPIHLSVGSIYDKPLFDFINHMVTTMQPWVQIKKLTIQRCGNVDDSMLKELNENNRSDLIEARFDLEWIHTLEKNHDNK